MPAADAAYITASQWADRLARTDNIDWIATEQACQAYHAAQWDTAQRLLAGVDSSNQHTYSAVRDTRGRIALARGRTEDALTDARAIIGYATSANNDDASTTASPWKGSATSPPVATRKHSRPASDSWAAGSDSGGYDQPRDRAVRDHTDPRQRGPPPSRFATRRCCCPKQAAGETHSYTSPSSVTPPPPPSTSRSAASPSPQTRTCSPLNRRPKSASTMKPRPTPRRF